MGRLIQCRRRQLPTINVLTREQITKFNSPKQSASAFSEPCIQKRTSVDNSQGRGTTFSEISPLQQASCPFSNPSEIVLLAFQSSASFSVESLAGSPGLSPSTYSTTIFAHFTSLTFHLSSTKLTTTIHPPDGEARAYDARDAEDDHPRKQIQKPSSLF